MFYFICKLSKAKEGIVTNDYDRGNKSSAYLPFIERRKMTEYRESQKPHF